MEHVRCSPHHTLALGVIRRLLAPFLIFQKHPVLGRGRADFGLLTTHELDVHNEIRQAAGPLYSIPGGLAFVTGLDIFRLPSWSNKNLRHVVFERGMFISFEVNIQARNDLALMSPSKCSHTFSYPTRGDQPGCGSLSRVYRSVRLRPVIILLMVRADCLG